MFEEQSLEENTENQNRYIQMLELREDFFPFQCLLYVILIEAL